MQLCSWQCSASNEFRRLRWRLCVTHRFRRTCPSLPPLSPPPLFAWSFPFMPCCPNCKHNTPCEDFLGVDRDAVVLRRVYLHATHRSIVLGLSVMNSNSQRGVARVSEKGEFWLCKVPFHVQIRACVRASVPFVRWQSTHGNQTLQPH